MNVNKGGRGRGRGDDRRKIEKNTRSTRVKTLTLHVKGVRGGGMHVRMFPYTVNRASVVPSVYTFHPTEHKGPISILREPVKEKEGEKHQKVKLGG